MPDLTQTTPDPMNPEATLQTQPAPAAPMPAPAPAPRPIEAADGWKALVPQDATAPVAEEAPVQRQDGPLPEPKAKLGAWETYNRTMEQDGMLQAFHRMAVQRGFQYDPDYNLPDPGTKEFKQLSHDIAPEQWVKLGSAVNADHAQWIANQIRESNATEQLLAESGAFGIAGRFAVNMMDPVGFALGAATGGIGILGKGVRLARTARTLELAGKVADASTTLRAAEAVAKGASLGKRMATAGGVNAAVNATLAEITVQGDPTRDQWDVAHAAVGGFLLGGAMSGVFGRSELGRLQTSIAETRQHINLAEMADHVQTRKTEIVERMAKGEHVTSLKHAQDDLAALQTEIAEKSKAYADGTAKAAGTLDPHALAAARVNMASISERLGKVAPESEAGQQLQASLAQATAQHDALVTKGATAADHARVQAAQQANPADALGILPEAERTAYTTKLETQQKAVADALGLHAKVEADANASMTKLTQLEEGGLQAFHAMNAEEATQTAEVFGKGSFGAARFKGLYESVHPDFESLPADAATGEARAPVSKMSLAGMAKAVGTFSGRFRGHDNPVVRNNYGELVGNSAGNADGSVNAFGASEHARMLARRYITKFNRATNEGYDTWAKEQGFSFREKWTRPVRNQFMDDIGLHIRGQESENATVREAGNKIRTLFDDLRKDAKEAGVQGFEDLEANPNYLPRVFKFSALERIEKQIGTENVRELFAKGIRQANPEIDDALAAKVAKFYVQRMKELRVGSDIGMLQGMTFDDIGFLRQFLKESGAASDEAEQIVQRFVDIKKAQHRDPEGSFRNAKHRAQFDENFGMNFKDSQAMVADGTDRTVTVKISDLLENNVEALFDRYQRSMSGHIGLAKIGIKSHADWMARRANVDGALEGDLKGLKTVQRDADMVYNIITGRPIEDASTLTRNVRLIRDWNYATTMNQAGFSQFPDWAALLSKGYVGHALMHFPEVVGVIRRARNGQLKDAEASMLEDWLGIGSDLYNNQVFASHDDLLGESFMEGAMGKAEHGLRVAGRVTTHISGLGWMNDVASRMAAKAIMARLAKEAREGGAISSKRLAQIGLDHPMMARIKAELSNTTEHADADFVGKSRIVNFAKWKDLEARDALLSGIFREARRMVQDEDLGDTAAWMQPFYMKMILQFRRFMMVSYSKQILHGIAMHDAEAATTFMVGSVLAAMSYSAQFGLKYATMDAGPDRDKFYAKYLTPGAIARAAWARGNFSSFLPAASDTITSTLLGERFFDVRASRLGSDLLSGNPTVDKLGLLGRAAGSIAQPLIRGDKQFTQSDARAWKQLLPFQNFIGADIPFHALTDGLPKKSEDADTKAIDWVWER